MLTEKEAKIIKDIINSKCKSGDSDRHYWLSMDDSIGVAKWCSKCSNGYFIKHDEPKILTGFDN